MSEKPEQPDANEPQPSEAMPVVTLETNKETLTADDPPGIYEGRWKYGSHHLVYGIWDGTSWVDPTKATKKTYMFNIARWVILHIDYKEKMKEKWVGECKIEILTIQNADTKEDCLELIRELMLLPSIRQRRFITKWCEGFTLRDIGKQERLTCERVRQIIAKGLWTIKSGAKAIASRMQMSFDDLGKELIHQASFDSHYK